MTAVAFSCTCALPVIAAAPEPLDSEFLDYLAACEGKDDNWTVIADEKQRRKAADESPPAATPPVDKAATPKAEDKP